MSEKLKKSPQEIKDNKAFEILQNLDVESPAQDEAQPKQDEVTDADEVFSDEVPRTIDQLRDMLKKAQAEALVFANKGKPRKALEKAKEIEKIKELIAGKEAIEEAFNQERLDEVEVVPDEPEPEVIEPIVIPEVAPEEVIEAEEALDEVEVVDDAEVIEDAEEVKEKKPKPGIAKRAAVGTGKFLLRTSLTALGESVSGAWKWIKLMANEVFDEIGKLVPGSGEIKKVANYFFRSKKEKS